MNGLSTLINTTWSGMTFNLVSPYGFQVCLDNVSERVRGEFQLPLVLTGKLGKSLSF